VHNRLGYNNNSRHDGEATGTNGPEGVVEAFLQLDQPPDCSLERGFKSSGGEGMFQVPIKSPCMLVGCGHMHSRGSRCCPT
jgi:hypothetical protein